MNTYIVTSNTPTDHERTLRALAFGFSVDYSDVRDLADVLGVENDYTELKHMLERATSLDDILARARFADERHGDY